MTVSLEPLPRTKDTIKTAPWIWTLITDLKGYPKKNTETESWTQTERLAWEEKKNGERLAL